MGAWRMCARQCSDMNEPYHFPCRQQVLDIMFGVPGIWGSLLGHIRSPPKCVIDLPTKPGQPLGFDFAGFSQKTDEGKVCWKRNGDTVTINFIDGERVGWSIFTGMADSLFSRGEVSEQQ